MEIATEYLVNQNNANSYFTGKWDETCAGFKNAIKVENVQGLNTIRSSEYLGVSRAPLLNTPEDIICLASQAYDEIHIIPILLEEEAEESSDEEEEEERMRKIHTMMRKKVLK